MLDFLIGKFIIKGAQKVIDRCEPKVFVHIPRDLPLPSVGTIKKMAKRVPAINALEEHMKQLSDDALRAKTGEFKAKYQEATKQKREELAGMEERYRQATSSQVREDTGPQITQIKEDFKKIKQAVLDSILPEAFAVVREVGERIISLRHYDIQLIGGMVLHEGKIAEMATGEGKTLVATLPAYLNALTGDGVHIVTVNDYLAQRDRAWMGPLFEFLGLTVGVILHDMDPGLRQEAYSSDITYGTNNEFGFDYLRDNMVGSREEMVQRQHYFAIVDEVDSILVDEARTPLIISGPAEESTDKYYKANEVSRKLKGRRITENEQIEAKHRNEDLTTGFDYVADEKARSVSLTEDGEEKAARQFGVANLHDMDTIEYRHHILQALKAKEFFKNDVDYVIREGQVIIVDEFTGRMMPGRRWSDGLHQAVESKEGIKIERENQTLATITFQNYFRMYDKLSGMTGTAYTEANEFQEIYDLDCVVMPTNRTLKRSNYTDCIYKTRQEKYNAVVAEIEECHKRGQPVLVGTISIEKSELVSELLKRQGIPHQVLNAKYHELEAQIVAQAGRYRAVTIATNMAGRGTDIVLGGNAEFLARNLAKQKTGTEESEEKEEELTKKFLAQFSEQVKTEHAQVVEVGGLHVLATERHESRRIDNQLRGRSGRQGDPGSSRFFVSLEDDLMRLFASDRIMAMMNKLGMEEGQVIEHPWVAKALEVAQKRVETHNFEIRKQLLEYDNVMNKQREAIYGLRRSILQSDNVKDRIVEALEDVVEGMVEQYLFSGSVSAAGLASDSASSEGTPGGLMGEGVEEVAWDIEGLDVYLHAKFNYDLGPQKNQLKDMQREQITELIRKELLAVYEQKEQDISSEHLRYLEKVILLNTIDTKWKDHLYAMDQLKEAVGLRSYAQRDPLVEYKREGFEMFQMMYISINQEIIETIFKVRPVEGARTRGVFSSLPQRMVHQDFSSLSSRQAPPLAGPAGGETQAGAPAAPHPEPYQKSGPKVGRNAPCPCGSGKKYKKCCGR